MITSSAYNAVNADVRAFWSNWSDQICAHVGAYYRDPLLYLQALRPMHCANRDLKWQTAILPTPNLNAPIIAENTDYLYPTLSPVYDYDFGGHYPDPWYWIPIIYSGHTRPKYRVPRIRRDPVARRRRNLV